ncbi:MAG: lactate utilization protein [Bacteroidales bacterium]|nr:lactate utilization protein [Bacteroidales bacterium]
MNTSEYKKFLHTCSKNINDFDVKLFDVDNTVHSVYDNIDKLQLQASKVRQKFVDNIANNLLDFEKNFISNKSYINWCLSYDDFYNSLLKLLDKKKIKSVSIFPSDFNNELSLEKMLKLEGISLFSKDNICSIHEPNFGIVDTGSFLSIFNSIFEMELLLDSKIKIFILPINKFICNISDIDIFAHILSIYKDNAKFPQISNIFTPNSAENKSETHLFIVDNGRSNLLSLKEQKKSLWCINCGACKKVCPVYKLIKDQPYNNSLTGPLANVMLPFLENYDSYKHLSFNSVLCGNCSKVCPVNIPITDLILENRKFFFESKIMNLEDNLLSLGLKKFLISRKNMNRRYWVKKYLLRKMLPNTIKKSIRIPSFSKKTFNQNEQQNKANIE